MYRFRMKFCTVHRYAKYGTKFGRRLGSNKITSGLWYSKIEALTASFFKNQWEKVHLYHVYFVLEQITQSSKKVVLSLLFMEKDNVFGYATGKKSNGILLPWTGTTFELLCYCKVFFFFFFK